MQQIESAKWDLYLAKIKESKRSRNITYANFFAPNISYALEYARTKYFPGNQVYVIDCRKATVTELNIIESGNKVDW